jgi:hypothetical protein
MATKKGSKPQWFQKAGVLTIEAAEAIRVLRNTQFAVNVFVMAKGYHASTVLSTSQVDNILKELSGDAYRRSSKNAHFLKAKALKERADALAFDPVLRAAFLMETGIATVTTDTRYAKPSHIVNNPTKSPIISTQPTSVPTESPLPVNHKGIHLLTPDNDEGHLVPTGDPSFGQQVGCNLAS